MDHLELTNIKNEPTESTLRYQMEILPKMQVESVKQEIDCSVQSGIHVKTEPQEDENEFPVIASTSYNMCSSYDMENETEEPVVKIEYENVVHGLMQDPLDVGNEIKDEELFPTDLGQGTVGNKTESTEEEKDDKLLETDEYFESQGSGSNLGQELLITNNSNHKDKKYVCSECHKKFKREWDLDNHLRIHTGERPYTCDVCMKTFTQKGPLMRHMLMHSGEKPHVCNVCKKVFRDKSALNKHKLIHSGGKPFSCDVCKKSFRQKHSLVIHKRIHTGDKPYTCDVCDKTFTQKTNLIEHRRLHTGEKPYTCDVCNKSFAKRSNLNKHKKIHKNYNYIFTG